MLIVFAGLSGTGKTTLSKVLAEKLNAVYLRIDTIEQAILNSSLKTKSVEESGYFIAHDVAQDNLKMGKVVVVDCVNPIEEARNSWVSLAQKLEKNIFQIEIVCSNEKEHRRRIEERIADISNHKLPAWSDVIEAKYDKWSSDRLVIDTAERKIKDCVEDIYSKIINSTHQFQ